MKDLNMKSVLTTVLASFVFSGAALADQKLAGTKNCLACHAVGTTVVGPSLKDVASCNVRLHVDPARPSS